ncbi:MAG: hypothetical protein AAF266_13410, partial [Planctomycetota bacterium]
MFSSTAQACRWFSRLLGLAQLSFVAATVVGVGPPNVTALPVDQAILFVWFGIAVIGLAVMWWREP